MPPSDDATVAASNEVGGEVGGATLAEERLKWQMEMENLRRECEAREGVERERCEEAVRGWRVRVEKMEQRCRVMSGEVEAERERGRELELTRQRSVTAFTYYRVSTVGNSWWLFFPVTATHISPRLSYWPLGTVGHPAVPL